MPVIVAVAVCAALGGMLVGSALLPGLLGHNAAGKEQQGLVLSGTETIKVLSPQGAVISTWKGPDPLTITAINAIAACLVGQTGPAGVSVYGDCPSSGSTWIQQVEIDFGTGCTFLTYYGGVCGVSDATATNTLTLNGQAGCDPSSPETTSNCNGWITEATFGPGTFTSTNCKTSCALQNVQTQLNIGPPNGPGSAAFDYLCTSEFGTIMVGTTPSPCTLTSSPATMSPGDSLLVTIQFTVS